MVTLSKAQIARLMLLERSGRLTPEEVLADARRRDSPLHRLIEWDRAKAALAYQLGQARAVIRSVQVTIVTETIEITAPRYVADPSPPAGTYRSFGELSANEQRLAVVQEARRATGHMQRAAALASSAGLDAGLDELIASWIKWGHEITPAQPIQLRSAAD